VTFSKKEDRDYYVQEDPAHTAFVKTLDALDDAIVFDFET
jgi:Stress responsive A/B Barrel Domain